MNLLAYWTWDAYQRDLGVERGFHFNSNQKRLHSAIEVGEYLWLVSGRPGPGGSDYVLLARLLVVEKELNPPGYKYGRHRLWGDGRFSVDYDANGPDASDVLLQLQFSPTSPIPGRHKVGQALQTIRALTPSDHDLLMGWASKHTTQRALSFRRDAEA